MSGRIICFEDIRECKPYVVKQYLNDYSCCPQRCENGILEEKDLKKEDFVEYTFYRHPEGNTLKSYVFEIDGYIIVNSADLEDIIMSNQVLCKMIKDEKIVECSLEEVEAYKIEQKKRHKEHKKRTKWPIKSSDLLIDNQCLVCIREKEL